MTVKIGGVTAEGKAFLAPMAGITDLPFRCLCKENGCALTYTEMVSAKALAYKNARTLSYLFTAGETGPIALQLFGREPDVIAFAAAEYSNGFDIIDINAGCPAPKIAKQGEGAALMKTPRLIGEIIYKTARSAKKPVTVKIRKGYDENSADAAEIAKIAEANGAAAVTVHGRYAYEFYSGNADWKIIKRVKNAVKIPVIGNGDVKTPNDAKNMLEETGCDAVMIGRAACGDPWIFDRINKYLSTGEIISEPSADIKIKTARAQAERMIELKGERVAANEMRKHLAWYIRGMKNSARMRAMINDAVTLAEMFGIFDNLGL